jgi:hypothetical protein
MIQRDHSFVQASSQRNPLVSVTVVRAQWQQGQQVHKSVQVLA